MTMSGQAKLTFYGLFLEIDIFTKQFLVNILKHFVICIAEIENEN